LDRQPRGKRPARKYQPGGITILHEDRDLLVVVKPAGLLTVGSDHDKSRTAHFLLNDYVRKGDPKSRNRVYVVHRLDQDTSGILLFAKSEAVKSFLQERWEETEKHYFAVVHGQLASREGTLVTRLVENAAQRVYSTKDPTKGKLSRTDYQVRQEGKGMSLVEIHLRSGRKHQIRVQFAELGHPVVGDRKYGRSDGARWLALHARSLAFIHPHNGRVMNFDCGLPEGFARLLGRVFAERRATDQA
jgi:tRNA pseudouridine32 synthase/23S rRNA pseudouridine746 synthase/23S rRNA pseudouridine1911/1915/1917 synthase